MPPLLNWSYTSDAGITFCVQLEAARAGVMGFVAAGADVAKRPRGLLTRKEKFVNPAGGSILLPYPTITPPHALGSTMVLHGVTYTAVATLDERGTGVA